MGVFDEVPNFEKWNVNGLIHNMVKYYNYHSVEMKVVYRPDVASRLWIEIKIEIEDVAEDDYIKLSKNTFHVSGQRFDIIKDKVG